MERFTLRNEIKRTIYCKSVIRIMIAEFPFYRECNVEFKRNCVKKRRRKQVNCVKEVVLKVNSLTNGCSPMHEYVTKETFEWLILVVPTITLLEK